MNVEAAGAATVVAGTAGRHPDRAATMSVHVARWEERDEPRRGMGRVSKHEMAPGCSRAGNGTAGGKDHDIRQLLVLGMRVHARERKNENENYSVSHDNILL